jgi:hypothetical protein
MEEFEEMKKRSLEDVEELLGVSFVHAFTSLLPFFFSKKETVCESMRRMGKGIL